MSRAWVGVGQLFAPRLAWLKPARVVTMTDMRKRVKDYGALSWRDLLAWYAAMWRGWKARRRG
jgi:hypothetical protein